MQENILQKVVMTAFADRTVVTIAVSLRLLRLNQTFFLLLPFFTSILFVFQYFSPFNTLFFPPFFSLFTTLTLLVFLHLSLGLSLSSLPSLPPAPRLLYPGRWAGVGLLLRDLGGMWFWPKPAGPGGEPVQCVSEDSQVDPDQYGALHLCPTLSRTSVFCFFFGLFLVVLVLIADLLQPYCHWTPR